MRLQDDKDCMRQADKPTSWPTLSCVCIQFVTRQAMSGLRFELTGSGRYSIFSRLVTKLHACPKSRMPKRWDGVWILVHRD